MHEVGKEEQPLGNWLASMMIHPDIVAKLQEHPVSQDPVPLPVMFRDTDVQVSHDEFIAFVRAYLGVASLLAVLAWADSIGNDDCRERTLGIVSLWQGDEGYREVSSAPNSNPLHSRTQFLTISQFSVRSSTTSSFYDNSLADLNG